MKALHSLGYRSTTLCQQQIRSQFKPGDKVALSGWISYARKQKETSFIGLKDSFGSIQVVAPSSNKNAVNVRLEDVLTVKGILKERHGRENEFELEADEIIIDNRTKHPLPLVVDEERKDGNNLTPQQRDASLKYRYLDLRISPYLQRNLRIRNAAAIAMRNYMINDAGFLEVETPTLFKSTPEGAREFLVPVPISEKESKPRFYALVQSPQQYKQMLMVGGIDRYFQFARCYRDEGGRADRQPEFTQLDLEMSFVKYSRDVECVIEGVVCAGWEAAAKLAPSIVPRVPKSPLFPHMKLDYAMQNYGSDKPDLTFGMKIDQESFSVIAPKLWSALSRREKDEMKKHLLQEKMVDEIRNIGEDVIVLVKDKSVKRLGRARLYMAQLMKQKGVPLPPGEMEPHSPIWITEFGMFEPNENGVDGVSCVHHPFTAPHPDDLPKLEATLKAIRESKSDEEKKQNQTRLFSGLRALHYDLVCDGVELGGGSIRIHSPDLQTRVFQNALGMSESECQAKFGHLLEALSLGAPPHGGFALGFDRFIATLCGAKSITDTLAFPKSTAGMDPLTGAPCSFEQDEETLQLSRLGLRSIK